MRLRTLFLTSLLIGAAFGAAGVAHALSCAQQGWQAELVPTSTTVDGVVVEEESLSPRLMRYLGSFQLREGLADATYEGEYRAVHLQPEEL